MNLPFTNDEFLHVFERYNVAIWPAQVVFYLLALLVIAALLTRKEHASLFAMASIAFFWAWMGIVYHILFFTSINKAANIFGLLFIIQSILFLYFGVIRNRISLVFRLDVPGVLASALIVYALIFYPLMGNLFGHAYPSAPTFGVPCPTTIFTFGILLFSVNRLPWYLLFIPLLWSIIGFTAALELSVQQDWGLLIAGLVAAFVLLLYKPKAALKKAKVSI